jgi:hypothetical protein
MYLTSYSPNQKHLAADAQREQEKCLRDIQRVQHETRRELSVLNEVSRNMDEIWWSRN